jgi:hypothetical protein
MSKTISVLGSGVLIVSLMSIGVGGLATATGPARQAARPAGASAVVSSDCGAQRVPIFPPLPPGSQKITIDTDYGKMSVYFIPNQGQLAEPVAYYVQGKDKNLYFTPEGITIALSKPGATEPAPSKGNPERINPGMPEEKARTPEGRWGNIENGAERWVVKLNFVGAAKGVKPVGEGETGAVVSYFQGQQKNWKTGLRTYSKIVYRELWPGIDLAYEGTVNRLKYEFIVHPGADPSMVRLAYRGVGNLSVDEAGRLNVSTPLGGFQDDTPIAYQNIHGERRNVAVRYRLGANQEPAGQGMDSRSVPAIAAQGYGFATGSYDRSRTLVIDPAVLIYCGYIGGGSSLWDKGYAIAVDASGSAYITGSAYSAEDSFPVTAGPDLTYNGYEDAFVAKLNPSGTALVYCGYIGGSSHDDGRGIAVDGSGNAYVTGSTSSGGSFPTLLGPDISVNGQTEAFVAKVNPAGTALVYCGFIGGAGNDEGNGLALDASGNAYVTGVTYSDQSTFPVAVGPDLTFNGQTFFAEPFVAKVNAVGTGLVYCGYIGGTSTDIGRSIAVDVSGNAYLTGETYTHDGSFPALVGPDLTPNGSADAFVAKVNAAGTALVYCGYIGGSGEDSGIGIAVDLSGNAYVAGRAWSTESTFPVTVGPDLTGNGRSDAFVAKVDPAGTGLVYCGYIGGSAQDFAAGIRVDDSGNAYLVGETASSEASFPALVGPDSTYNGGNSDAFAAKVNPTGTGLVYCGYVGGSGYDTGYGIAVDRTGKVAITGSTDSRETSFPVTAGPDLTFNGYEDAFVAKILFWEADKPAVGDFDSDHMDEVAVDFGPAGIWLYDQGSWSQIAPENPEGLLGAKIELGPYDDLLADLGARGLWRWRDGSWSLFSGADVESMATGLAWPEGVSAPVTAFIGDFGRLGAWLWTWPSGWWQQSSMDPDQVVMAKISNPYVSWIIGDFGSLGMWWRYTNSDWLNLSRANAEFMIKGRWLIGMERLFADFGAAGLWAYQQGNHWTYLSGADPDSIITADITGDGVDEIVVDFGPAGLWLRDNYWTALSDADPEGMVAADVTGDGGDEVAVDFGLKGLWVWNDGAWSKISPLDSEYLSAADTNGDGAEEILADFGAAGFWLWNGVWTRISEDNPD